MLLNPFYDVIFKVVRIIGGRSDVDSDEVNLTRWELFSVKIAQFVSWLFCIGSVLIIEGIAEFEAALPPKFREHIEVFDHAEGAFFHIVKIAIFRKTLYAIIRTIYSKQVR